MESSGDDNTRQGRFLLIANSPKKQDTSVLPDEGLVVEGEENLDDLVDSALDEGIPLFNQNPNQAIPFSRGTILADDGTHIGDFVPQEDEIMDTASNIVFRPLFKYKRQNIQKRRVFRDRDGNINPKPSQTQASPPQYLVYDKNSGSYYPVTSLNPYYNTRG